MSTNYEQLTQRIDRLEVVLEDALQAAFNKHDASTEKIIACVDTLKQQTTLLSTEVAHVASNQTTKIMYIVLTVSATQLILSEIIRHLF